MNSDVQKLVKTEAQAIAILLQGGVGVMASDTVYGVMARAADKAAVTRFYALKDRHHNPGPIIAANMQQLADLGIEHRYLKRVENLWPNPLSIETPMPDELAYLHQDTGRQALRVVADKHLQEILEQTGPLVTSSANQPNKPGAVDIAEAQAYFGDKVDFYVDNGDMSGRAPSTIIRLIDDDIEVIREGAVKFDENGKLLEVQDSSIH